MNHDNHSCMIREMFPERVKHIQSIVDMLPRKAVPVLSLRNARAKSVVSIEHKTTTIHRTTTGSKYKMQWSNRNVPYSNVFKTYSVEYASDPRFKIQGAGQSSPWHLESWILDPRRIQQNTFWIRLNTTYLGPRREFCTWRWGRNIRFTGTFPSINPRRSATQEPIPSQSRDWEDRRGYMGGGYHICYPPPHVPTLCAWIVRDRRRVPANLPNLHYSSSYATHTKVLTCSFMPAPSVVSLYIYKWCSSCDQCLCYHGYTHRSYCFRNTNPANTLYFPLSYYVINTLPGTLVLWLLFTLFYTSPTCKSTCMDRWILRLFTFW